MTDRELPAGWVWTTLEEVTDNLDRLRKPISAAVRANRTGAVPYYGATGQVGTIDEALFDEELVLLGEDGVRFFDPFKTKAYVIRGKSWVNNHAHVLRARPTTSNAFLLHYLNQFNYKGYANGTTRLKLTKAAANNIPIPLPPLPEQHRIVEVLEDHLSRLDAANANLAAAQARVSSLHRTRPDPASPEFDFPRRTLKSLLREPLRNGHSGRVTHSDSGVRAVTLSAVTNNEFSHRYTKLTDTPESKAQSLWLEDGDIFVQRSNTPDLVGSSALYRGPKEWAIFPDLLIRVRADEHEVLPKYLTEVLRSEAVKAYFRRSARGLSGSMPKISQSTIEEVVVPLPSIERQQQWVDEAQESRTTATRLSHSSADARARCRALRRSLLRAAFNGELVDQDPTDEPAAIALEQLRKKQRATATRRRLSASATS